MRLFPPAQRLAWLGGACGALYAGAIGFLKVSEQEMVFRASETLADSVRPLHAALRPLVLPGEAGPLTGIVAAPASAMDRGIWVLYMHGQGSSVWRRVEQGHDLQLRNAGYHVLAADYRGFARNPGTPTEQAVYADVRAAWRYLTDSLHVPATRIVIVGFSLGSGPATQLATEVPAAGLVLVGGFTSVPDRGQELYPALPVTLVASQQFANRGKLATLGAMPVALVHALDDATIPFAHAERNLAAIRGPKRLFAVRGGHVEGGWGDNHTVGDAIAWVLAQRAAATP